MRERIIQEEGRDRRHVATLLGVIYGSKYQANKKRVSKSLREEADRKKGARETLTAGKTQIPERKISYNKFLLLTDG